MERYFLTNEEMENLKRYGLVITDSHSVASGNKNFCLTDMLSVLPKAFNKDDTAYFRTILSDVTGDVIVYCTEHINKILYRSYSKEGLLIACYNMFIELKKEGII